MWHRAITEDVAEAEVEVQPPTYAKGERAAKIRKLALNYPDLSNAEIARAVKCDPSNVTHVLNGFFKGISTDQLAEFQACKADIFDAMQYRTLASITDSDIANASYLQRVTGAAILEDKARLVRGQATSINVSALVDVAAMIRERKYGTGK